MSRPGVSPCSSSTARASCYSTAAMALYYSRLRLDAAPVRRVLLWDPVTDDQLRVAVPAGLDPKRTEISGAVLRATGDVQHFQVVCVATRCDDIQHGEAAVACVYSSETGEWGNPVAAPIPSGSSIELYRMLSFRTISREPAVLVGDSIYWILTTSSTSIVQFNFEMQSLAVPIDHFKVIRADSGGLGFLYMSAEDQL